MAIKEYIEEYLGWRFRAPSFLGRFPTIEPHPHPQEYFKK
jgi:hypothetical protein